MRLTVPPAQTVPLLAAVGVAGMAFTTTIAEAEELTQPFTETKTEYVPASADEMPTTVGFCWVEAKPFAPVQKYDALAMLEAVSFSVSPSQTAPLTLAAGADGNAFTFTETVSAALTQPFSVSVTK